jgi:hypothetical protein
MEGDVIASAVRRHLLGPAETAGRTWQSLG